MANFNNSGRVHRIPMNVLNQNTIMPPSLGRPGTHGGGPPPLPPRVQSFNSSIDMGYNSYAPYGSYGGYGGYGGYSPFGSYGYPHRAGMYNGRALDDVDSSFIRLAEESSRPAFQSIESIVHTFANVTMMLESTFHAMQTSFRAVVGVAENFNKLRHLSIQVAKYISALTMLRTIYWFCKRMLYMLGLLKTHPSTEDIWKAAERVSNGGATNGKAGELSIRSSWPVITYFTLLFGGPYAMYKLLSSFKSADKKEKVKWDPRTHESLDAVAIYHFKAATNLELSISQGEILKVAPKKYHDSSKPGWIEAVNLQNRFGLVPMNYIKVVIFKPKGKSEKLEDKSTVPSQPEATAPSTNESTPPVEMKPVTTQNEESKPSTSVAEIDNNLS